MQHMIFLMDRVTYVSQGQSLPCVITTVQKKKKKEETFHMRYDTMLTA